MRNEQGSGAEPTGPRESEAGLAAVDVMHELNADGVCVIVFKGEGIDMGVKKGPQIRTSDIVFALEALKVNLIRRSQESGA